MYNIDNNFLEQIKYPSRIVSCKVLLGDIEFTDSEVISFSIEDSFSNSELPGIGGVVASRLKLKLLNSSKVPTYITTQKIKPYVAIEVKEKQSDGTIIIKKPFIPMGVFYPDIDSIVKTDSIIEIECMDELTHFENSEYNSKLTFPTNASNIVNELARDYGIAIGDISLLNGCTVKVKPEKTVRAILSEIAELAGANATMSREGKLEFRKLKKVNFSLDSSNYIELKILSDNTSNITKLICEKGGTNENEEEIPDLEAGDTKGATLRFENDSITTKAELQAIYNKFMPIEYTPYELKLQGMPHLDCGDIFTLTDNKNTVRELYILNHNFEYNGGMISEFKAGAIKKDVKIGSNGSNSISDAVNGVVKDQIIVNEILAGNITADNIHANAITTDKLTAGCVTAEKIKAGTIISDNIQAGTITGDKIQAGTITAGNIAAGSITAGSGIIADGAIGNAQISNLDADKIVSGTIDTSDVTIAGANGNLRIKGNRLQVFTGIGSQQKERVSLGDVNADGSVYGLRVRGKDGKTILLDENGVKTEGITDGSITNDKINPNAGIEGGKLNIDSVIDKINSDGSKTINSVKIDVDAKSLSAVIKEINDKSTEHGANISSNTAAIKANKDNINLKVDSQTYTADKDKMNTQLNKNTSSIDVLKNQINLKVEQTDIDNAITKVGSDFNKQVEDVKNSVNDLDSYVNTALKDGIIDATELKNLEQHLVILDREKKDLDASYEVIYYNSNLKRRCTLWMK